MRWHDISLLCIVLSCAITTDAAAKPSRTECIIGFDLDWSQVKDRHGVRYSLFQLARSEMANMPLAGMVISDDGSRLYLQYREACEKKREMAADLITLWRLEGLDLPTFERIPAPITPSPWTIELRGPYWADIQ